MFNGLADWWDGVELWLAQAWFPVQFVLVMLVVVPLCLGVSLVVARVFHVLFERHFINAAADSKSSARPQSPASAAPAAWSAGA